jgi:hypothetical protein
MKPRDQRFRPAGMGWWVDPRICSVHVADVQTYLLNRGWKPKPQPRPGMIFFEKPAENGRPAVVLTLPASEELDDYLRRVTELITALASFEERYAVDVLNDILRQSAPPSRARTNDTRGAT